MRMGRMNMLFLRGVIMGVEVRVGMIVVGVDVKMNALFPQPPQREATQSDEENSHPQIHNVLHRFWQFQAEQKHRQTDYCDG